MICTLRMLGLAVLAVGALSAVSAADANAETLFHCEVEPCTLTGTAHEGKDRFEASGFIVECVTQAAGTASIKTQTVQSLSEATTGCETSLGQAQVDTTGCSYVFNSTTNATGHLPVSISCTGTNQIKVTAPGCTLSFGSQATVGGAMVTNIGFGSSRELTAHITTTSTFTKSGSLCFAISGNTGTYTSTYTVKGYIDNGVCSNLNSPPWNCPEGAQAGVWWE